MAACCGKSTTKGGSEEPDVDVHDKLRETPANTLPLERVHAILDRMSEANADDPRRGAARKTKSRDDNDEESAEPEDEDAKALRQSANVNNAM